MSTADEIAKLAALRDAGELSTVEFEAEKAKLLGAPAPGQAPSPITSKAPAASSRQRTRKPIVLSPRRERFHSAIYKALTPGQRAPGAAAHRVSKTTGILAVMLFIFGAGLLVASAVGGGLGFVCVCLIVLVLEFTQIGRIAKVWTRRR